MGNESDLIIERVESAESPEHADRLLLLFRLRLRNPSPTYPMNVGDCWLVSLVGRVDLNAKFEGWSEGEPQVAPGDEGGYTAVFLVDRDSVPEGVMANRGIMAFLVDEDVQFGVAESHDVHVPALNKDGTLQTLDKPRSVWIRFRKQDR